MPVMTGYEATRLIRGIEAERRIAYEHQQQIHSALLPPYMDSFPFQTQPPPKAISPSSMGSIDLHLLAPKLHFNPPALIIALTGFSSQNDRQIAFDAGVDVFMTKPVRFREVGKILEEWANNRDTSMGGN
jgi:CheY-like chemotaxis protein